MRILQLTKKFPYPLKDGESIAIYYLSSALARLDCSITLLSMNTARHYFDLKSLPVSFDHYKNIETVEIDNRIKVAGAFINLFSRNSYHVTRFISQAYTAKLKAMLQADSYDIILLETLYLTPYVPVIRKYSAAKIVMRSHNLEYEIWERMLNNMKFSLKKLYIQYLVRKLKRYELKNLNVYDFLITVSKRDLSNFVKLGFNNQGYVVPIGIDIKHYPLTPFPESGKLKVSFIGSLDWMPNMEGLTWFIEKVWLPFREPLKDVELHIAGRNTPDNLYKMKGRNLFIHGEVDNAIEFLSSCQMTIVPLFSGSGMRVKILESMALGRVVISTTLGLEGISAQHGQHVLLAETAKEFMNQILFCKNHPEEMLKISAKARKLIREKYDNTSNARHFVESVSNCREDANSAT